jgi:Ala-tRNA(Pro) deacylase
MKDIYAVLKEIGIPYVKHDHQAVFTVEEAAQYDLQFEGAKSKNLFLTNKTGDAYYLLVVDAQTRVDLKKVTAFVNEAKLSFASPEKLFDYLELTPGSVSPFGLINDSEKAITVLIDKTLMKQDKIGFHPNKNTATLIITTSDFKKFLDWTGNRVFYLEV